MAVDKSASLATDSRGVRVTILGNRIRVDDVLPPIPRDAVGFADNVREALEPPFMMCTNIAVTPISTRDNTGFAR